MPSCTDEQRRKAVENGRGVRRVGDARDAQAGIPHAPQVECNFLLRQKVIAAPHLREVAEPWLH